MKGYLYRETIEGDVCISLYCFDLLHLVLFVVRGFFRLFRIALTMFFRALLLGFAFLVLPAYMALLEYIAFSVGGGGLRGMVFPVVLRCGVVPSASIGYHRIYTVVAVVAFIRSLGGLRSWRYSLSLCCALLLLIRQYSAFAVQFDCLMCIACYVALGFPLCAFGRCIHQALCAWLPVECGNLSMRFLSLQWRCSACNLATFRHVSAYRSGVTLFRCICGASSVIQ